MNQYVLFQFESVYVINFSLKNNIQLIALLIDSYQLKKSKPFIILWNNEFSHFIKTDKHKLIKIVCMRIKLITRLKTQKNVHLINKD